MVGAFNVLVDFSIYLLLTRVIAEDFRPHYLVANFIAFCGGATSSYFLNKFWTFRDKNKNIPTQYAKFFIISIGGLMINEAILFLLVEYGGLLDLIAKGGAIVVGYFWNFYANNKWTFTNENSSDDSLSD